MEHNQMTSITRRSLTLGLGASAALAAASPPIVADAAGQRAVLPSVASRKIGAAQVTAVSDGFIDVPFDVFTGAPISEIEAAFATRFSRPSTGMHRLGFTVWLVDDGDRLVLIDTGYASLGGPTTGRLFHLSAGPTDALARRPFCLLERVCHDTATSLPLRG
jgi:hypothetical protein